MRLPELPPMRPATSSCLTLALMAGLLAAQLAGCASAPPAPPPATLPVVPAQFKEAALFQPARTTVPVPQAWWTVFGDPVLNDLQARLVVGNETLKSSLSAYKLAQAALASSRAGLQPTLGAGLTAQRSSSPPQQEAGNNFGLSASASWEVDLWGRLAGAVDASQARLEASWADVAAARLSLQATLTQSYLAVRHAQAQAAAVQSAVAGYQRSLQLTRNRYQAGVASAADVAQAETQLKSAQVQLLEWQITRAQLEHAIATLLGQAPASFTLEPARVPSTLPDAPAVPMQLPAQLLERRPDIAAAERRVAAAWAQVGVADAAFFPSLTLQASTGFRNDRLQSLIGAPNFLWSFGPQLALAALDGGARQSASDSARASAEQATSVYRQVVLTALQEVEDNLVAVARLDQEQALQAEALASARKALEVVSNQYQAGTVSYLNVVAAQSTALSSEQNLLNVRNRRLAATNTLLKNLAGRWDPLPAPEPGRSKPERPLDRDETRLVD
jgi:NodT family efflux transporter outer membrane factor (OMF) lipoprotein